MMSSGVRGRRKKGVLLLLPLQLFRLHQGDAMI
jgi:hypothetical protein